MLMVSLWRHLYVRQLAVRLVLTIGFGFWALLFILLFLRNMIRNFRVSGPWFTQTNITESDGLYKLEPHGELLSTSKFLALSSSSATLRQSSISS